MFSIPYWLIVVLIIAGIILYGARLGSRRSMDWWVEAENTAMGCTLMVIGAALAIGFGLGWLIFH